MITYTRKPLSMKDIQYLIYGLNKAPVFRIRFSYLPPGNGVFIVTAHWVLGRQRGNPTYLLVLFVDHIWIQLLSSNFLCLTAVKERAARLQKGALITKSHFSSKAPLFLCTSLHEATQQQQTKPNKTHHPFQNQCQHLSQAVSGAKTVILCENFYISRAGKCLIVNAHQISWSISVVFRNTSLLNSRGNEKRGLLRHGHTRQLDVAIRD